MESTRSYINGYAEPEIRYGRGQQGIGSLVNTLTKDDDKDLSFNCKMVKEYYGPEKLLMRWVIQLTRDVLPGEELYCYYGVNARFAKPDAGVRDDNDDKKGDKCESGSATTKNNSTPCAYISSILVYKLPQYA